MSRASRRFHRTLFLAIAAMGALVWVVVDQFDISGDELAVLITGAVMVVAAIMVCAAILAGIWVALKKFTDDED
ncbi:MAG: hypothetical protein HKN19_07790 [Halioglobus sp.]|nr:hypothetical protein [Halioglobus sp.]